MLVQRDIMVAARDGVGLATDVYRPEGKGPFPVILERTPYDKRNSAAFAVRAAAKGYVVIIQDVRGRYKIVFTFLTDVLGLATDQASAEACRWEHVISHDVADRLLDFFLLEKVCYELEYEMGHRPTWLRIPLGGLQRILARSQRAPT